MNAREGLVVLSLLAVGCAGPPHGASFAIPALAPLDTVGGAQLRVDASGDVVSRTRPDDIENALGVALEAVDGGLRVVSRLSANTPLREEDVIRVACPPLVGDVAAVTTALERVRRSGHAVRTLEDIRGYALCPNRLDLVVTRAGEEHVVRVQVAAREQPLAVRRWGAGSHALGVELCRVADLPPELRPSHASPERGDLLVLRVDNDARIGLRGLRPLDVIVGPVEHAWDLWEAPHGARRQVIGPRGWWRRIDFTDLALDEFPAGPFVEVRDEGGRRRVEVLDVMVGSVLRYEEDWHYSRRGDRHVRAADWFVLSLLFFDLVHVSIRDSQTESVRVWPVSVLFSRDAE